MWLLLRTSPRASGCASVWSVRLCVCIGGQKQRDNVKDLCEYVCNVLTSHPAGHGASPKDVFKTSRRHETLIWFPSFPAFSSSFHMAHGKACLVLPVEK